MSAVEPQDTTRESEEILKRIADEGSGSEFDIFAGALALAALERPRIELARYRDHMSKFIDDVHAHAKGSLDTLEESIAALRQAIVVDNDYQGDVETYDDIFRMPT